MNLPPLRDRALAEQRLESAKSQYENENWLRPKAPPWEQAKLEEIGLDADTFENAAAMRELLLRVYDY